MSLSFIKNQEVFKWQIYAWERRLIGSASNVYQRIVLSWASAFSEIPCNRGFSRKEKKKLHPLLKEVGAKRQTVF